jgi:hypothetical protein
MAHGYVQVDTADLQVDPGCRIPPKEEFAVLRKNATISLFIQTEFARS